VTPGTLFQTLKRVMIQALRGLKCALSVAGPGGHRRPVRVTAWPDVADAPHQTGSWSAGTSLIAADADRARSQRSTS
jgi:hypothetical protein